MDSTIRLSLLGTVHVTRDGVPVSNFRSRKAIAVLGYLAVHGQPVPRERLADLFWPDQPEDRGRANLSWILNRVSSLLPDCLEADHTVHFCCPGNYWLDVESFRELAARGGADAWAAAVDLYRGDLLEGLYLDGCAEFELWLVSERERWRQLAADLFASLIAHRAQRGDYEGALSFGRRLLALQPWREEAHRQVMELLAWSGQRSAALAQYETCYRVLAEELGVEPGAETTRLYDQIRDGDLEVSTLRPVPAREREPVELLPGFLTEDAEEVQPPVFVARERELVRLECLLKTTLAGRGSVTFVIGGAGRGKTALLAEFARRAMEAHPDLLVASGSCNAYSGIGDPYLPFCEVLGQLTGNVESRWATGTITRDHARRLWAALPKAAQVLLEHGPHVTAALLPGGALLSRCTGAGSQSAPWYQRLRQHVERQRTQPGGLEQSYLFQQVTNLLRALSEDHPLLLILDDLQWADTASIGLLFHLARRLEGYRILVAGAYRPDEIALGRQGQRHPLEQALAEFKRHFGDAWVDLGRVDEREGQQFVAALLKTEAHRLGEGFRQALFRHTQGHPLFTIELLKAMQERGDIVQDKEGRWLEGPSLSWEALPARVEAVIEERIGRVEGELREVLSVASVEGEEFTAQVVARVQNIQERRLLRALSHDLEKRHRLVRERAEIRIGRRLLSRYRFAHHLFQKYLYNSLGAGERRLLHGEIGAVLEGLYEGCTDELASIAPQLAYHYSQAGDEGRTLKYLTLAGDGAMASYANEEAESYYRRALGLATAEAERAHLLSEMGQALHRQGRFQEAMGTWGQGIELYRALEDSDGLARLYARSARAASFADKPAEQLGLCREGLALVEGAPDSPGLARLLDATARAHWSNPLPKEKGAFFAQQALEMAERLGDVEAQAHALATLVGFVHPADVDDLAALTRAVEIAESAGLLDAATRAHGILGIHCIRIPGKYRTGLEHLRRAVDLNRQMGDIAGQVFALARLVTNCMWCGVFEEVDSMLAQMRGLLSDLGERSSVEDDVLDVELEYLAFRGEWAECAQLARAGQASARERGDRVTLSFRRLWLGRVILESRWLQSGVFVGTWEEAEAAMTEASEINSSGGQPSQAWCAWLGLLFVAQGRLDKARRLLAKARKNPREQPWPYDEAMLSILAAQLAAAEGHWMESLSAFEAAVEAIDCLGWRWHQARWRLNWAEVHAARGEPADRDRASELLREAQTAFEEMGIPRFAAMAVERLQKLGLPEKAAT
jgi:DNA-binding SARP family transcriptional activator